MIIIIKNQTSVQLSYLAGNVLVDALTNLQVPANFIFPVSRDSGLIFDSKNYNVILNDGMNDYAGTDALNYLNQIANSLGGAVVGLAGSAAPSYEITVGGKDSAGKSQPARMNQFADLATNFRNTFLNLTGNATTTVKSGAGTLHGVMINNNSTGGVVKLYDNTAGSGTLIATIQIGSPSGGLLSANGIPIPVFIGPLGVEFLTGLTVVTSGSATNNVTVLYQ